MEAVALGLVGLLLILLGAAGAAIAVARRELVLVRGDFDDAVEAARHARRELEQDRRLRVLEGELVVVNTPKPDDQSIRGVVRQELESGLLVLTGAVYLERDVDHGRQVVREVPAGDVAVAGPKLGSWVQILYAPPGQES